jgi:hypothetical protein
MPRRNPSRRGRRALLAYAPAALATALALACAPAPATGQTTPSVCKQTPDPVCEYLAKADQAPPVATYTSTLPGAIEPQPVNQALMEQFWAEVEEWKARGRLATTPAQPWSVAMYPGLKAGLVGWCVRVTVGTIPSSHCGLDPRGGAPIAYESWEATPTGELGLAIGPEPLEAVAVDDASTGEPALPVLGPAGVRAAVVLLAAPVTAKSGWYDEFDVVDRGLRNSGERGWGAPPRSYSVVQPTTSWAAPGSAPPGPCSVVVAPLRGLHARSGHVASALAPSPAVLGGGFLSCADTEVAFEHQALEAAVLLNPAAPGAAAPEGLPGATAVPHHPGLYSAPGWTGRLLARRAGDAWLVVEGGTSLRQRIEVLSHLRSAVS